MSEAIVLNAEVRKDVGKGASRRLRRADMVPGIIYGGENPPVQVKLQGKTIRKVMEGESFYSQILTVVVDGNSQQAILKDIQRHPAKEFAMHLDFQRIDAAHVFTTHVPLHFLNEAACKGVKKMGGAITHARVEVEIRCLPHDLPAFIEVDMLNVGLGEHVHLSDLLMPNGVELVALGQGEAHDLDIASVQATRTEIDENESEDADSSQEKDGE